MKTTVKTGHYRLEPNETLSLCDQVLESLHDSSYFNPHCQIHVSMTPNQTIRLSGRVDNFHLKQQAICSALRRIEPELLEDHIQVNPATRTTLIGGKEL
ncbi:MAG: hypothetical protein HUJ26_10055 [Planctomycetaceae bacterium]|nr:hypothetical protein [Planctomycetaceae bacterium]